MHPNISKNVRIYKYNCPQKRHTFGGSYVISFDIQFFSHTFGGLYGSVRRRMTFQYAKAWLEYSRIPVTSFITVISGGKSIFSLKTESSTSSIARPRNNSPPTSAG